MESIEKKKDKHEQLRGRLLAGQIEPNEFLETLLDWDQSDADRTAAEANIRLLEDPEVAGSFLGTEHEVAYFDHLGFFHFHQGQTQEMLGGTGLPEFEAALDCLKKGQLFDDGGDWERYVTATIAYLNNDKESLRRCIQEGDANESLLRNFLRGLEDRGNPNYLEDYSKKR